MSAGKEQRWISPDAYLTDEKTSDVRREYVNGHVFTLSAGGAAHDRILRRLTALLQPAACGGACHVYGGDVKLRVETTNAFYYPDVVLTCEKCDENGVVYAPGLLAEVVVPDTAQVDRREKLAAYLTIPWLKEYVLVDAAAPRVDVWRRTPDGWRCDDVGGAACVLECGGATLTVEQIYAAE